jgi:hypothetical protein
MNPTEPEIDYSTAGRMCYFVPADSYIKNKGFRVSVVFENLSGHYPTGGQGKEPWYWGLDYITAKKVEKEQNKRMGLSEKDVCEIITKSMVNQNRSR